MTINNLKNESAIGAIIPKSSGISFTLSAGSYELFYTPTNQTLYFFNSVGKTIIKSGFGTVTVLFDEEVKLVNDNSEFSASIYFIPTKNRIETGSSLTLDTISTTSTYTQTGYAAKVIIIGGGQGGSTGTSSGGAGGAGGKVVHADSVALPGNIPVVIGTGGPPAPTGALGGDSSFGSFSSASQGYTAPGGVRGLAQQPALPQAGTPGTPGTPGILSITPVNAFNIPSLYPYAAGSGGAYTGTAGAGGGGGGIAAGGGGGGGGLAPNPGTNRYTGGGGGGGGGGVPGNSGPPGSGPLPSFPAVPGGAGGAGRVFVLR